MDCRPQDHSLAEDPCKVMTLHLPPHHYGKALMSELGRLARGKKESSFTPGWLFSLFAGYLDP